METNFTSDAASRIESAEEPAAVPASKDTRICPLCEGKGCDYCANAGTYTDENDAVPASKPDADEVIRELRDALVYAINVRSIDCLHSSPKPDPICAKCTAEMALSRAAAYRKEKERG